MLPCDGGEAQGVRSDGLGGRRIGFDARWGYIETLELAEELSTPIAELAVRGALQRVSRAGSVLNPVHAIERSGATLRVIGAAVDGRRLCDILEAMEARTLRLPDEALLELAAMIVTVVRWLHETPGAGCHGALSPAHMVLRENGQMVLTDGMFGDAIARLRRNHEQLWKEFGLVLPPASEPALDQRADVACIGAAILALLLRRPLRDAEYPRAMADLIVTATAPLPEWGPSMRAWLQQSLQLAAPFSSAAEASATFAGVLQIATRRREGARALLAQLFSTARAS